MPVYLIHFERRYRHAGHYLGYSHDLEARIRAHRTNEGARLLQVVNEAGIGWGVVRVWDGGFEMEQALKARKNAPQLCPVCNPRLVDVGVVKPPVLLKTPRDRIVIEGVEAFRLWLCQFEEGAVVGMADESQACPLACWLQEVYGGQWWVNAGRFRWRVGEWALWQDWQALPAWAIVFVHLLYERYGSQPVSCIQALEVLEWVLVEVPYRCDDPVSHQAGLWRMS